MPIQSVNQKKEIFNFFAKILYENNNIIIFAAV